MRSILLLLAFMATTAQAATTYNLPDPAVSVNPNYGNTTTIVTIAGVAYRGPSQFVYFSECARPDAPNAYRCNIETESNVVLTAEDGSVVVVNLTVQFASVLIRSGHNFWRPSQIVLSGDVTVN